MYPKIGIVYLLYYHNHSHVDDMVSALRKVRYPQDKLELIIVVNPYADEGSFVRYIEDSVMPLSGRELPPVTLLPQEENLGFAGGNNVGTRAALEKGCDYVYYHNNDGFIATDALIPLVRACENDKKIAIAQSLLMLYPDTEYINSTGNCFHYLGFGFCENYRKKLKEISLPKVKDISYASGAAMLVRADVIKQHGNWDEDFFMYHEDLEWTLRLRSLNYKVVLVSDSVFYHKYQFSRSIQKFFYMDRNRYAIMLMYFKWPTLLLLAPMALILEIGLWIFAWQGKWVKERVKVYKYYLQKDSWKLWLRKRKKIQQIRKVTDRQLLKSAVSGIYFQEKNMENPLLKYIGNPIMYAYYKVVVKGLIWW